MYEFRTVSDIASYTANMLEQHSILGNFSVCGEITGLTVYNQSGHLYFSLSDRKAQINCVMFASYAARMNFKPEDGMKVKITGTASLYPRYGRFQIKVFTMQREGAGDLMEQYRLLYEKLASEGVFDAAHKKSLPMLPGRIGVITSAEGAVIHDIINTLDRRNPHYDLLIFPAAVQGEKCPPDVIAGIDYFMRHKNVDVIIIARGGGSLEELFGFNDEGIARKVYECDIPIISAVGHEVNNTLCDAAADLRAPTPTAAAELVLTAYDDFVNDIANRKLKLEMAIDNYILTRKRKLEILKNHKALYSPMFYVQKQRSLLQNLTDRIFFSATSLVNREKNNIESLCNKLNVASDRKLLDRKNELSGLIDKLDSLGPVNVLKRGYSHILTDSGSVSSVTELNIGDKVKIVFADGSADAQINELYIEKEN